jgi:hypothetical protein
VTQRRGLYGTSACPSLHWTLVALVPGQHLTSCLHPPYQLLISTSLNIWLDTSSCSRDIYASVLRDERQISSIASKSLNSSSYKELKNKEALAKDTMSVLSYCEMALYGISESLQHSNIELPEETMQLCSSLHVGLASCHSLPSHVNNAVLKRRDYVISEAKSVFRLPQLTGALRSEPLRESFLFQDSL